MAVTIRSAIAKLTRNTDLELCSALCIITAPRTQRLPRTPNTQAAPPISRYGIETTLEGRFRLFFNIPNPVWVWASALTPQPKLRARNQRRGCFVSPTHSKSENHPYAGLVAHSISKWNHSLWWVGFAKVTLPKWYLFPRWNHPALKKKISYFRGWACETISPLSENTPPKFKQPYHCWLAKKCL